MDGAREVVAVLSDAPHRLAILRTLREAPRDLRDMRAELDEPRATVKHNLTRLQDADLVAETGMTYRLTAFGRYVLEEYADCLAGVGRAVGLRPFLEFVSPHTFDYDLAPLSGSTVTEAGSSNPHAPVQRFRELLADTDHARVVVPVVVPMVVEELYDGVADDRMELELVVPADLEPVAQSRFADEYEAALGCDRLQVGLYDGEIPFCLGVLDDTLVLGGYDDGNILRCLVENDSAAAVRWGLDRYREFEREVESSFGKLEA